MGVRVFESKFGWISAGFSSKNRFSECFSGTGVLTGCRRQPAFALKLIEDCCSIRIKRGFVELRGFGGFWWSESELCEGRVAVCRVEAGVQLVKVASVECSQLPAHRLNIIIKHWRFLYIC